MLFCAILVRICVAATLDKGQIEARCLLLGIARFKYTLAIHCKNDEENEPQSVVFSRVNHEKLPGRQETDTFWRAISIHCR
jgi:hypothetical protein